MATSAFKSTTKRTPITKSPTTTTADDTSSSSSAHRRSRSLSRFSHRLHTPADDFSDEAPARRGRFVNTVRGSGFPEISLDDLSVQFSGSGDRGRSNLRNGEVNVSEKASASQRRGRSVSRKGSFGNSYSGGRTNPESNSGRRRSVSVARYQISDSESDLDHSQNSNIHTSLKNFASGNGKLPLSDKKTAQNHRQGLRRSLSQKDMKYRDGYLSHSSALTDDEATDAYSGNNAMEKTIRAVYSTKKVEHPVGDDINSGLYQVMRKELRNAVEEIRTELEEAMSTTVASDDYSQSGVVHQAVSTIRRNCSTKVEQSEKHKQDLLAEILLEKRGRELSKIVKKLLLESKNTVAEKPSRARKKSNDRNRMSKRLTEEAGRYIEDFILNVEDTDISSLDGERSDTSSTFGGGRTKTEDFQSPIIHKPLPVEMDGVVLPWLQWEASASPLSCGNKETTTPRTKLWDAAQETTAAQDISNHSISSRGSWSPGVTDGHSTNITKVAGSKFAELGNYPCELSTGGMRLRFNIDEYLICQNNEDFLLERWKQQQRTHSGGLLLCSQNVSQLSSLI